MSAPRALYLICTAGMGDVLMVLAAAKALKARFHCAVFLCTHSKYCQLAKACKHVDDAFSNWQTLNKAIAPYPPGTVAGVNLTSYSVSISPLHQVDAYLAAFDIEAPADLKELELRPDAVSDAQAEKLIASWPALPAGKARILIHPALSDPHKTWPRARWEGLSSHFIAAGHQVVVIGERTPEIGRSVHDLAVAGLVTAVDRLEPLGTVALMRRAHLLVSTDSGPIQLAAATDIGKLLVFTPSWRQKIGCPSDTVRLGRTRRGCRQRVQHTPALKSCVIRRTSNRSTEQFGKGGTAVATLLPSGA